MAKFKHQGKELKTLPKRMIDRNIYKIITPKGKRINVMFQAQGRFRPKGFAVVNRNTYKNIFKVGGKIKTKEQLKDWIKSH